MMGTRLRMRQFLHQAIEKILATHKEIYPYIVYNNIFIRLYCVMNMKYSAFAVAAAVAFDRCCW